MFYTEEELSEIKLFRAEWIEREKSLETNFLFRRYRKTEAKVLAHQGFIRRLQILIRCIDKIFELIPPEHENPNRDSINDAEIYLQAFIINIYGALDNLARLWVWETNLKRDNGKVLPQAKIGLGPKAEIIRCSLSEKMQIHLRSMDQWFLYLENYRHALAHRIPVYIPPRVLNEADIVEWGRLEDELSLAIDVKDYSKFESLFNRQSGLGRFVPWMMHSYGNTEIDAVPMQLHAQLLCDLATIVEVSEKMAKELDRLDGN